MEEEKKLYPMKFIPLTETFSWGTICHHIADLGYMDSLLKNGWLAGNTIGELMDMYMDRISGERAFAFYGRQFPIGVKVVDVKERMPLVVHPDDETAGPRFDFLGKSKLWYVLSAGPKACVSFGLAAEADASSIYSGCADGSVYGQLNNVHVREGDCFHILPGTVHCAEDVRILEISESSPLDFILCSWGMENPGSDSDSLGLVEALDFIDYRPAVRRIPSEATLMADSDELEVRRMEIGNSLHVGHEENDSFAVYTCVSGNASFRVAGVSLELNTGESVLVPAEVGDFEIVPHSDGTVLLESGVRKGAEADTYIDPDAGDSPEDGEFSEDDENYLD